MTSSTIKDVPIETLQTPEQKQITEGLSTDETIVYPETLLVADQSYGKSQETLDAQIALRNLDTTSITFVAGPGISITQLGNTVTITNTEPESLDPFLLMGA